MVGIVGNEDGAHHVTAELYQALVDVGFNIPGGSSTHWFGEPMASVDYEGLTRTPKQVIQPIDTLANNAAHLAKRLDKSPFPAP